MESNFGSRLREEIGRLGLTQADFARRVGTTRGHVSLLCDNKRVPSLLMVEKIAKELYVHKEWLLTGEGEKDVSRIEVLDDDETDIIASIGKYHQLGASEYQK